MSTVMLISFYLWILCLLMDYQMIKMKVISIYKKRKIYSKMLELCDAKLGHGKSFTRACIKSILIILAKCVGYKYWAHKLDQLAKQYDYNTSNHVGAITGGVYGEAESMVKNAFEKRCPYRV